jgi:hypothetical protein
MISAGNNTWSPNISPKIFYHDCHQISPHLREVRASNPTSVSWLNAVKGLFPSSGSSAASLKASSISRGAINPFLAETNDNPKPITGTADPDAIIEKLRRGKQALEPMP